MNINLNLATRPYLELRPVYGRLRTAAVLFFVLALPMLLVLRTAQSRAQLAQARVDQLRNNIALLRRQQANARALTRQGANAQVLDQAAFLNELFRRKSFSWSATMSDLETTLPAGVQVQVINPVIASDGRVSLQLRIVGARDRAVEVVHNLERSRHFIAPRLVAEAANQNNSTQGRPALQEVSASEVTFDILAEYRPLPNSHPSTGRGRPGKLAAEVRETPAEAPQAQLTNPEATPAPQPLPSNRNPLRYHPSPPVTTGGLPAIPPPLGERQ